MMKTSAIDAQTAMDAFAALSQPTRLATVKLLVRHWPEALSAGAVAEAVGAPPSTLSTHLAILTRAGLVSSRRESRTIFYAAELQGITDLIGFLVEDCCDGRPEICTPVTQTLAAATACCPANESGAAKPAGRRRRAISTSRRPT